MSPLVGPTQLLIFFPLGQNLVLAASHAVHSQKYPVVAAYACMLPGVHPDKLLEINAVWLARLMSCAMGWLDDHDVAAGAPCIVVVILGLVAAS